MTIQAMFGLILAMIVLAASPGPGVMATVARALASGFRPALAVIAGIVLGDILFLGFAVFGLSAIARVLGELFFIVKICGGAYLMWLGSRLLFANETADIPRADVRNASPARNLVSGLLITLSNPKVILFYCGFLPTFLELDKLTPMGGALVAGIVASVLGAVLASYAYLATRAALLFTNRRGIRRLHQAAGGVMVATGVLVASRS
ncbi:MAG: LysE family translocator [Deltaproteobacteria bacterium]|nr:LysE family translocator [Deltaproteobacteria bacterium]